MADPRMCCKFCFKEDRLVPAIFLAPHHDGGDVDRPANWVPICDDHAQTWYDDTTEEEKLPMFAFGV